MPKKKRPAHAPTAAVIEALRSMPVRPAIWAQTTVTLNGGTRITAIGTSESIWKKAIDGILLLQHAEDGAITIVAANQVSDMYMKNGVGYSTEGDGEW